MDIVEKMPDKWIKELTSCVSRKGLLFLDWYDAENLRDFIKAKDEEIERLREENNDLKSALRNVLFAEVSHVKVTEFTKEKE